VFIELRVICDGKNIMEKNKDIKSSMFQAVKNAGQEMRIASEIMYSQKLSPEKLDSLRKDLDVFRRRFKESGYDHDLAILMTRECGLTSLLHIPPNRLEIYFEVLPGTSLLPLFNALISSDGKIIENYGVSESFFLTVATGMRLEKSKIIFDTVLQSHDLSLVALRLSQHAFLSGVEPAALAVAKASIDTITTQRINEVIEHFR